MPTRVCEHELSNKRLQGAQLSNLERIPHNGGGSAGGVAKILASCLNYEEVRVWEGTAGRWVTVQTR